MRLYILTIYSIKRLFRQIDGYKTNNLFEKKSLSKEAKEGKKRFIIASALRVCERPQESGYARPKREFFYEVYIYILEEGKTKSERNKRSKKKVRINLCVIYVPLKKHYSLVDAPARE